MRLFPFTMFLLIIMIGIPISLSAADYYVNAETGSDFGNGTLSDPWRTITFALTGPHSPIPQGSTIHLMGTSTVNYSLSNGESFPLNIYGNINFIGEPDIDNPNVIIDGEDRILTPLIFKYASDMEVASPTSIESVEFWNSQTAIEAMPSDVLFELTIQNCIFKSNDLGLYIKGDTGATLNPTIVDNEVSITSGYITNAFVKYEAPGCIANGHISNNHVTVEQGSWGSGFLFRDHPSGGALSVRENVISVRKSSGINAFYYSGEIDISNNTITADEQGTCVYLRACNPWHPDSKIEGNACTLKKAYGFFVTTSNVVIRDNKCLADPSSQFTTGVSVGEACQNVVIDNNILKSNGMGLGISVSQYGATNVQITNNEIDHWYDGIRSYSDSPVICENIVTNNLHMGIVVSNISTEGLIAYNHRVRSNKVGILVNSSVQNLGSVISFL